MNARNPIKPKSIRLALLLALSDGSITTIDDLLLRVDEPRKKVIENAGAAEQNNLLKRLRDDVTGLAAYQITADGKKYLANHADGSNAEPEQAPAPEAEPADEIPAETPPPLGISKAVIAQQDDEIANLSRRLRDAFADVDRLSKELDAANAALAFSRSARIVSTSGYVIQRPAKPLVRFGKIENAQARALSFARSGKKAQVFALIPVGHAQPGAEWKEA